VARRLALKKLPSTEKEAYEAIVNHIKNNTRFSMGPVVLRVLSWIYHAKRPLQMDEILEVLLLPDHINEICEGEYTAKEIIATCESLIIHETLSGVVRFCHATVREWLPESTVWNDLQSSLDIARTCLSYLGQDEFDEPCTSKDSLSQRLKSYRLSKYASQFWGQHAREVEAEVQNEVLKTFQSQEKRESMYQISQFHDMQRYDIFYPGMNLTLLHILCQNGLSFICGAFKGRGFDFDHLYVLSIIIKH
jgi:hypothetical protein